MNYADILYAKKFAGGGGSAPTLIEKEITEIGTYSASDDDADGYSEVNVNVISTHNAEFGAPTREMTTTEFSNHPDVLRYGLTYLDIPEGYTKLNANTNNSPSFSNLKFLRCPHSLVELRSNFIRSNALEAAILLGVATISDNTFSFCNNLKQVVMPSVITIGSKAFFLCSKLIDIEIGSDCETIASDAFDGFYYADPPRVIRIHKPEGSIPGAPWGSSAQYTQVIWDE